jgi:hypothetical protein
VALDNLRVPFVTSAKFKILSFRSRDPQFKTDPRVIPSEEEREKAGITVVQTPFRHNDMRDTGREEARASIQTMLDKFLVETESEPAPVEPSTPNIIGPMTPYVPGAPVQNCPPASHASIEAHWFGFSLTFGTPKPHF